MPAIRRKKPGPAKRFSRVDNVHHDRLMFHYRAFETDASSLNYVEAVRRFACSENHLAGFEAAVLSATREQIQMFPAHSCQKWMIGDSVEDIEVVVRAFAGQTFGFHANMITVTLATRCSAIG